MADTGAADERFMSAALCCRPAESAGYALYFKHRVDSVRHSRVGGLFIGEKMNTKTTEKIERKVLFSTLWIVVSFNMAYADILSLFIPGVLEELEQFAGTTPITLPCSCINRILFA